MKSVQKCIWLASYPKSGNTWTRVFLHNLLGLSERPNSPPYDINDLGQENVWEFKARDYEEFLKKPAALASAAEIAEARFKVQQKIAARSESPFLIKTHNAVANVGGFPTINLDVTLAAVYIVRNPLDVAISYAHHCDLSVSQIIGYMADEKLGSTVDEHNVYEFLGGWSYHVASWLSLPYRPVLVLRFEDMLANPKATFRQLADFLGIKSSPELIDKAITYSSFDQLKAQETANGFKERPDRAKKFFRSGMTDQWREALTRDQFNAVISSHAPMMMRCGYLTPMSGAELKSRQKSK